MNPKELSKLTNLIKSWPGPAIFEFGTEKDLARYISERLRVEEKEIRIDEHNQNSKR